jgi:hypothetical protein
VAVAAPLTPSPIFAGESTTDRMVERYLYSRTYPIISSEKITFKENPSINGQIKVTSSVFNSKNTLLKNIIL